MVSKEMMERLIEIAQELNFLAEETHLDICISTCAFCTSFINVQNRHVQEKAGAEKYRMISYYVGENGDIVPMYDDPEIPLKGE